MSQSITSTACRMQYCMIHSGHESKALILVALHFSAFRQLIVSHNIMNSHGLQATLAESLTNSVPVTSLHCLARYSEYIMPYTVEISTASACTYLVTLDLKGAASKQPAVRRLLCTLWHTSLWNHWSSSNGKNAASGPKQTLAVD